MANAQAPANKMSNSRQQPAAMQDMDPAEMGRDMVQFMREYVQENPEKAALWCLGIGFVLGWKLKPW